MIIRSPGELNMCNLMHFYSLATVTLCLKVIKSRLGLNVLEDLHATIRFG